MTYCALRTLTFESRTGSRAPASDYILILSGFAVHSSTIATARVQPADARSIFTGKQETVKPVDGGDSNCAISRYGSSRCGAPPCGPPR